MSRNSRLTNRSIFVYGIIIIVALILLGLVTPDLWGEAGFSPLFVLIAAVPLILFVTLVVLLFGSSKTSTKLANGEILKTLGATVLGASALSFVVTAISENLDPFAPGTWFYFLQNTGVAMNFLAAAAGLLLVNFRQFTYWPLWNRSDKNRADEREKFVRQRVFEKAYGLNIIISAVILFLYSGATHRMHAVLVCILLTSIFFLPAVIAAWQKDS
jgi:hypothetical protein